MKRPIGRPKGKTKQPPKPKAGRVCKAEGCQTVLNSYNGTGVCALHRFKQACEDIPKKPW